ncbi:MAG TPA: hypothetical protein VK638_00670 [Edaphobacter sp.]|nr:hypothetical protein [Edaphobacter sp.]
MGAVEDVRRILHPELYAITAEVKAINQRMDDRLQAAERQAELRHEVLMAVLEAFRAELRSEFLLLRLEAS